MYVYHGQSKSKEYKIWKGIKTRCYTPSATGFENYGGRGITVCKRWLISFENFLDDMGLCPEGFSLDRKNNNGNYSPSNCAWVCKSKQARNKRNTIKLKFKNKNLTIPEWSRLLSISKFTLYTRLRRGWNTKDILTRRK